MFVSILGTETQHFCPHDWIGFQDKCYYFSKEEGDWNSSRYNCSTQHTDLTMIDTVEEMVTNLICILMNYLE